jgi:hypothetical protein
MSDMAVESFDIADRDAPAKRAEVALAANVDAIAIDDGMVARLSQDWWTGGSRLEIVDVAHAQDAEPLGRLDLDAIGGDGADACWAYGWWGAELFAHDGFVYLVREIYEQDTGESSTRIEVVDARDATAPAFVRTVEVPGARQWWGYTAGLSLPEARTEKVGDALVLLMGAGDYDGEMPDASASFAVVDLSDPAAPTLAATVDRPDGLAHGGLQVHDGAIVSWHMQAVDGDPSRVRYFLERLDVSDPQTPVAATPLNVPGAVVAYDAGAQRAVTVDFRLEAVPSTDDDCWVHPQVFEYDDGEGVCWIAHRELKLVAVHDDHASLLQTLDLEAGTSRVAGIAASADRLFVHLGPGGYWGWDVGVAEDGAGDPAFAYPPTEIATLTGLGGDALEVASRVQIEQLGWWLGTVTAAGHDLLLNTDNGLGVLDTADPAAPSLQIHELWGYACWNVEVDAGVAYCPMGAYGLQAIEL